MVGVVGVGGVLISLDSRIAQFDTGYQGGLGNYLQTLEKGR